MPTFRVVSVWSYTSPTRTVEAESAEAIDLASYREREPHIEMPPHVFEGNRLYVDNPDNPSELIMVASTVTGE